VPSQLERATGVRTGDTLTLHIGASVLRLRVAGAYFDPNDYRAVHIDSRDLAALPASATPADTTFTRVDVGLAGGADQQAVLASAEQLDGVHLEVRGAHSDLTPFAIIDGVLLGLTAVVAAVAGLGVLNTVALSTRERQRHLAVLRAIGMEPRQVVTMVVTTTALLGLLAGAVAIPAGIALHRTILGAMADIANTDAPQALFDVFRWTYLPLLALSGVAIATIGAMLPARWIARQPAAEVLRAE
jgi:putative ABC transport system permease protein